MATQAQARLAQNAQHGRYNMPCAALLAARFRSGEPSHSHRICVSQVTATGKAALVKTMSQWEVCEPADGQINGPGHGGVMQTTKQAGFDCSIECVQ